MAVNPEAADALTQEVKDLVKDLQDRNNHLEKKVESLSTYIKELRQEISDMENREYDV
jgi:chaperonin cofactor prefoldin